MAMKIARVEPGSEAEVLGLGPGDELLSVDENELNDSLDYDFYTDSKSFHLKAKVADGIREWDVQRTERGPFGCDFQTYHSKHRTKRSFDVNLFSKKFYYVEEGCWISLKISAAGLNKHQHSFSRLSRH